MESQIEVLGDIGSGHRNQERRPHAISGSRLLLGIVVFLSVQFPSVPALSAAAPAPAYRPLERSPQATPVVYCFQGQVDDPRLVVVDKSRQRLMVFRYLGHLALEYEFPSATGEQDGKKMVSADERTPEGVYFVTHRYKDRKVTIFGDRALHLNYPNASDQARGRKGDGIFIHGSNRRFKPRSSNGCIVLTNQDMARVEPLLREQSTPVIVVDRLDLPTPAEREQACEFLRTLDLSRLDKGSSLLPEHLSLVSNQVQGADLKRLAQDLSRLGPGVKTKTLGMALWGAGEQWVLVLQQALQGPRKQGLRVTRRFYLEGPRYQELKVVQRQWVLSDLKQARLLASWAPPRPVVMASQTAPAGAETAQQQIRQMVVRWLAAWQAKQLRRYMSFYARDFRGSGRNRRQWRRHKAYLNKVYKTIKVKIDHLQIKVSGNRATVDFQQHYRSDYHRDLGYKTLRLVLRKGRWQIQREDWRAGQKASS